MGYSNRRVYCGTINFYYPVNQYNSKPMPVCQNGLKEMLRTAADYLLEPKTQGILIAIGKLYP